MAARPPGPPPRRAADRRAAGLVAAGAAAFAAAELLAAILIGRFFDWGRAEALLFFAFRPWLLLAAAVAAARWRLGRRLSLYGAALLLAALSETLLLIRLGASDPWSEMLRGMAGGALLAAAAEALVQAGRRWLGRFGRAIAAAAGAALLLVPGALRPYEAIVLGPGERTAAGPRPRVMLMTGLPLLWGEKGAFDPESRPAAAYRELQKEFSFEPVDVLDRASLAHGRLLLLAQPQRLSPAELAAVDAWIRGGGRAVILADPLLAWPSELPLGDIRRPPPVSLLGPLLGHWGLTLEPAAPGVVVDHWHGMRLRMQARGRFRDRADDCVVHREWLAFCQFGQGRALVIADADLMRDALWAPFGAERHRRTADNPAVVARWLDFAAGRERERIARRVAWADPGANRSIALAAATLPILVCGAGGLLLRRRRRR
jgi:ABC transporter family protein